MTPEGGYLFDCQHGDDECIGNIMLACAKKYIVQQDDYVDFSLCVMMADDPPTAGSEVSHGRMVAESEVSQSHSC